MPTCSITQACPTLCSRIDYSLPGSSVQGIFQARILKWVFIFLLQGILLIQVVNLSLLHLLPYQADSLPLHQLGSSTSLLGIFLNSLFANGLKSKRFIMVKTSPWLAAYWTLWPNLFFFQWFLILLLHGSSNYFLMIF